MFTLTIETVNDDFTTHASEAVAALLQKVHEDLIVGFPSGSIYDSNGNRVGNWKLTDD